MNFIIGSLKISNTLGIAATFFVLFCTPEQKAKKVFNSDEMRALFGNFCPERKLESKKLKAIRFDFEGRATVLLQHNWFRCHIKAEYFLNDSQKAYAKRKKWYAEDAWNHILFEEVYKSANLKVILSTVKGRAIQYFTVEHENYSLEYDVPHVVQLSKDQWGSYNFQQWGHHSYGEWLKAYKLPNESTPKEVDNRQKGIRLMRQFVDLLQQVD